MKVLFLKLYARFERVWRYLVAGIGVTAFYSALVTLLIVSQAISSPTVAAVIGSILSAPVSFLVHARVTYPDVQHDRAHVVRFMVITVISFVIVTASMHLVERIGAPFWVGLVIGWILVPIANYLLNTVCVFRPRSVLRVQQGGERPPLGGEECP
ncbi:MAG: GtrA family protein [Hyphomonas sp.]|nr:GtrA family protein [Hyphomonas sp.]